MSEVSRTRNFDGIHRRRGGYMLMEMVITMVLIVMLLSISSVWIQKTFLYCSAVSERDSHHRSIFRVSRQLRNDAALAEEINTDGKTISLVMGDRKTDYAIAESSISRSQSLGGRTSVDRFTFAKNANLRWIESEKPNQWTLEIRRSFSKFTADKNSSSKLDAEIRIRATGQSPRSDQEQTQP